VEWVFARWITLTATLLALGAVAVLLTLLPRVTAQRSWVDAARRSAVAVGLAAAIALWPAALVRLTDQVLALDPTSAIAAWQQAPALLRHTTWGTGFLTHLAAIIIAFVAFMRARRHDTTITRTLLIIAGAGLAVTPALQGHAVASAASPWLAVTLDTLHVLGAGVWIGGLAVVGWLSLALRREDGSLVTESRFVADARLRALVPLIPPLALTGASMLLLAGVGSSVLHLRGVRDLWDSEWGRFVLIKGGLLAVTAALGAYNWRRLGPGLASEHSGQRLRQTLAVELAIAALALVVTSVLIITPPPGE
jgi:putative copper export protein